MVNHDLVNSNLHPRPYRPEEVVRIVNSTQFKLYIANGIYRIDRKRGSTILGMVFLKEESKEAYELWCRYEVEEDTI